MSIINVSEVEMVKVDLEHAKARLERNAQTGTAYYVGKAIKHLDGVIGLFDEVEHYGDSVYSQDVDSLEHGRSNEK